MKPILGLAAAGVLLIGAARAAVATPPAAGQHFDCSDAGTTSCASDDTGCVSNTKNHAKCSSAITKAFGKAVVAVMKCHCRQATARLAGATAVSAGTDEDENCEDGVTGKTAKEKLEAAIAKVGATGVCDPSQFGFASAEETLLFDPTQMFSLDAQNGYTFCDASSAEFLADKLCHDGSNAGNPCNGDGDCPGGGTCIREDTGFVPSSKAFLTCECKAGKELGKLIVATARCHDGMNSAFLAGDDFDEEACEQQAHDRYSKARDKTLAKGICPACLDQAGWETLASNTLTQVDGANGLAYPCTLGP